MMTATELSTSINYNENKLIKKINKKVIKSAKKGYHSYIYKIKDGKGIVISNDIPFSDANYIKGYFENLGYKVEFLYFFEKYIIGVQINW